MTRPRPSNTITATSPGLPGRLIWRDIFSSDRSATTMRPSAGAETTAVTRPVSGDRKVSDHTGAVARRARG